MIPALGAAIGVGALLGGLIVVAVGVIGTIGPSRPPSAFGTAIARLFGAGLSQSARRTRRILIVSAAVVFVVAWVYTGIPLAAVAGAACVVSLPWLFGAGRADAKMIARLEAIEIWTRRVSDLVRSGSGLHQAIVNSAVDAPAPIAAEVLELAIELRSQLPTADALRLFADRLADATSDEVIAAVILNARERGPRLADVLDRVSESMADMITMRREQSSARTDARISAMFLSGMVLIGLMLLLVNKGYMKPYHSFTGQIVLASCLVMFGGLLAWCRQMNMPRRLPRLLRAAPPVRLPAPAPVREAPGLATAPPQPKWVRT
ncbi:MAG TPA: type II secretion system F family protein [Micromonosporaceae bacterium]|jgi:Flp pilus assembly protein TadB